MEKNIPNKHQELCSQGKVSENKIITLMAVLIVLILVLNLLAFHSAGVEVNPDDLPVVSEQIHTNNLPTKSD